MLSQLTDEELRLLEAEALENAEAKERAMDERQQQMGIDQSAGF